MCFGCSAGPVRLGQAYVLTTGVMWRFCYPLGVDRLLSLRRRRMATLAVALVGVDIGRISAKPDMRWPGSRGGNAVFPHPSAQPFLLPSGLMTYVNRNVAPTAAGVGRSLSCPVAFSYLRKVQTASSGSSRDPRVIRPRQQYRVEKPAVGRTSQRRSPQP